jgi:hypothetical protein
VATAQQKFWKPQEEDFVVMDVTKNQTITRSADALATGTVDSPVVDQAEIEEPLLTRFAKRKTIYSTEIEVESDSVRISFYDNGDIDGDSISVFVNNQPVLVKQELTSRALNIYIKLDSTRAVNEITMFAENLGKYPPNTALMLVTDGVNRHEVYLSSSLTQNAGVKIRRRR